MGGNVKSAAADKINAAISSGDLPSRSKTMALKTEHVLAMKERSAAAYEPERQFYARKPAVPTMSFTKSDGSIGVNTERDFASAKRQADGSVRIGEGENQRTVSAEKYSEIRANFQSARAAFNRNYEEWHKEGWGRGYIAGAPNERL